MNLLSGEFVGGAILRPVTRAHSPDRPDERGALVGSQLIGLGMMRYVVRLEPLASAPRDAASATSRARTCSTP